MTDHEPDLSIVGLQEIAPLLEVDDRTPHAWWFRKILPVPDYSRINGLRAWDRSTIVAWAAETGRLPDSGVLDTEVPKGAEIPPYRGGRAATARAHEKWAQAEAVSA